MKKIFGWQFADFAIEYRRNLCDRCDQHSYTRILTKRIRILQQFMKKLTKDDFEAEMPAGLLKVEDEIGDLARSGKKMQESIRRQVEYDEMTQLYNRRYGDKNLLKMKAQMQISGIKYCVAIGDIDFFKKVNVIRA